MIKGSINVSKVNKAKLFRGAKGTYLNFVMYENDEPDQYGNHYVIKFDLSQEDRQAGEKAQIIGNAKNIASGRKPAPALKPKPTPKQADPDLDAPEEDVPF